MKPVQLTLPLAETPSYDMRAGSMRRKEAIQEALKKALKNCILQREDVADELSRLVGEPVSKNHIDNWTAESRNGWRLPLEYAAALSIITGDTGVLKAAIEGTGLRVICDEDLAYYELGKIVAEERTRGKKKRLVMEKLGL